jgi:hypothetical protein
MINTATCFAFVPCRASIMFMSILFIIDSTRPSYPSVIMQGKVVLKSIAIASLQTQGIFCVLEEVDERRLLLVEIVGLV